MKANVLEIRNFCVKVNGKELLRNLNIVIP